VAGAQAMALLRANDLRPFQKNYFRKKETQKNNSDPRIEKKKKQQKTRAGLPHLIAQKYSRTRYM
jgi:hypothetical protein